MAPSVRVNAASLFLLADHSPSRLSQREVSEFLRSHRFGMEVAARLPVDDEGINTCREGMFAIPIDHFDYGLVLPFPWEFVEILNHYGIVPAQLPTNSVAAISSFINYLRSARVTFTLNLFRSAFSARTRPEAKKKEHRGFVYFACVGMAVVGLPNKIHNWPERFLIFEGDFGRVLARPEDRDEATFKPAANLLSVEKEILAVLAKTRLDTRYYAHLWDGVAGVTREDTELRVPETMPRLPEGEALTQREQRKKKQEKGKEPATEEGSSRGFRLKGFGRKHKDTKGGPLLRWDDEGESVTVSTNLPKWSGPISSTAGIVASALFGKKNYKEISAVDARDLPDVAAQSLVRATVANTFLSSAFRSMTKELDDVIEEYEKKLKASRALAYDASNPDFQKAVMGQVKMGVDEAFDALREKKALVAEFEDISFDTLFPEVAQMLDNPSPAASEAAQGEESGRVMETGQSSRGGLEEGGETERESPVRSGSRYSPDDTTSKSSSGTRSTSSDSEPSATSTPSADSPKSPQKKKKKT